MDQRQIKKLIQMAKSASLNSYSPYSELKVGAALLCENGTIFTGTNVENSSYGLTVCAERIAVFKAITHGLNEFKHLVIYVDSEKIVPPCGACLQVIAEFTHDKKDFALTCSNEQNHETFELRELYSHPFIFKSHS